MRDRLTILFRQPAPMRFLASRLLPRLGIHPAIDYFGVGITLGRSKLSQSLYAEGVEGRRCDAQFIVNNLQEGDVYVDVGANVGTLALLAAKQVGSAGLSIAFEGNPRSFCEMLRNVQVNNMQMVSCLCAVGDRSGFTRFTDGAADDQNKVDGKGSLAVYMTTLDAALPGIIGERRIRLLKIDVEGYEYFVLKGARNILDRVDIIYFEISDPMLEENGVTSSELLGLLTDRGFSISFPDGAPVEPRGDEGFQKAQNLVARRVLG